MKPHAMIVEDDEPLSIVLRYNLEAQGFAVTTAASAEEAENALRATTPDIILIDWGLPGQSGVAFCRDLRARPQIRHVRILLITAKAEDADRERGRAAGADAFLVKPFPLDDLIASLRSRLGTRITNHSEKHAAKPRLAECF